MTHNKITISILVVLIVIFAVAVYWYQRSDAVWIQPPSDMQEQSDEPLTDFSLSDEFKENWNVAENTGDSVMLVKEQENTRYEIRMSVISIDKNPREWIEDQVDFDDVTTLNYEWSFVNDVQHVRVDYDGPYGPTRSDYLLGNDRIVSVMHNPLDADYDTERLYSILLHSDAYARVDPVYSRSILRENCAQDVSNNNIDDITVNPEHQVATLHWTNYETNENQRLTVAYEPETGFAGCSASVTTLLADRRDAVRFACPNDYQFTMIYLGEENREALLQLPAAETHRVSVARSGSGARYTNEDESVVFWEHQGEASIEVDGEMVREQCVVSN